MMNGIIMITQLLRWSQNWWTKTGDTRDQKWQIFFGSRLISMISFIHQNIYHIIKKNLLVNFKLSIRLSVFQNEPLSGYYSTSLGSGGRFFIKWVLSFLTGTSILIIFHHPEKVETLWSKCTWNLKKKRSNDFMFSYT